MPGAFDPSNYANSPFSSFSGNQQGTSSNSTTTPTLTGQGSQLLSQFNPGGTVGNAAQGNSYLLSLLKAPGSVNPYTQGLVNQAQSQFQNALPGQLLASRQASYGGPTGRAQINSDTTTANALLALSGYDTSTLNSQYNQDTQNALQASNQLGNQYLGAMGDSANVARGLVGQNSTGSTSSGAVGFQTPSAQNQSLMGNAATTAAAATPNNPSLQAPNQDSYNAWLMSTMGAQAPQSTQNPQAAFAPAAAGQPNQVQGTQANPALGPLGSLGAQMMGPNAYQQFIQGLAAQPGSGS